MTTDVLLSLGGNMGDRKALIDAAVASLAALPGTSVLARSPYYRTEPVGPVIQEWFVNIGVALVTELSEAKLRSACRAIEAALGRDRSREIPWGPRPIDIDVVAFGDSGLTDDRPFVIIPLAEIAPAFKVGDERLADRAGRADASGIRLLDWPADD